MIMINQFTMFRRAAALLAVPLLAIGLLTTADVPAALAEETHVTITPAAYGSTLSRSRSTRPPWSTCRPVQPK
jgi:hypothetical protein